MEAELYKLERKINKLIMDGTVDSIELLKLSRKVDKFIIKVTNSKFSTD